MRTELARAEVESICVMCMSRPQVC
uniref:Uncharacterized protein n=1 Tax=Arundo donax TaxID=35708 RepID=A0A0A9FU10_ARUDO